MLWVAIPVFGQNITLKGQLLDSLTNEPISEASISVDLKKLNAIYKTNAKGEFSITITKANHAISFKHFGYVPYWIYTTVYSADSTLTIKMALVENQLEQVVISSRKSEELFKKPMLGVNQINIKALQKIPTALGEVDFLRSLQMLPGVTSVGEASNGVNIRGGTTDQNLILIDDTPIFNPTHMFGMFSVVPPDALNNIDLYKGNVPARFGGRAASVLDISLKNPNLEKLKINGGLSLISGKLMVDVPIIKDKLGIYISARGTYTDFLLSKINSNFEIVNTNFSEVVSKLFWKLNSKNTFSAMTYLSQDEFKTDLLSSLPYVIGSKTFFEHYSQNFNAKWVRIINKNLDFSSSLTKVDYLPTIGTIETLTKYPVKLTSGISLLQAKASLNHNTERQKSEFGINFSKNKISPGELIPGNSYNVNPVKTPTEYSNEYAIYGDSEIEISKKLALNIGLRYSLFHALGNAEVRTYDPKQPKDEFTVIETKLYQKGEITKTYDGLEPRIGIRYLLNPSTTLKIGYNNMRQYLQIISNTTTPIPTSRWKTSDRNIAPQVSNLVTAGIYKTFEKNIFDLSVETYYRHSKNIIDYKSGADFLLQKFPETQLVQGISKSYGIELMVSKKKGNFTGWSNYTYARTFNRVFDNPHISELINGGKLYYANYDRPHSFNTSIDLVADKYNSFGFNFVLTSGRPYTKPVGFVYLNNNFFPFYDQRNNARIPAYHRLDFSWNITPPSKKGRYVGNWVLSIYNIYAHKNIYSVYFKSEKGAIRGYQLQIFGMPIGSLAYNFKF